MGTRSSGQTREIMLTVSLVSPLSSLSHSVELCAGTEVSARDAELGPEMKCQGADSVKSCNQRPERTCLDVSDHRIRRTWIVIHLLLSIKGEKRSSENESELQTWNRTKTQSSQLRETRSSIGHLRVHGWPPCFPTFREPRGFSCLLCFITCSPGWERFLTFLASSTCSS